MKIDDHVLAALREAIKKYRSQNALAEATGLHRTNPGRYLHGRSESIPDHNWEKLYPILSACYPALRAPQYLPPSELKKLATQYPASEAASNVKPVGPRRPCKIYSRAACASGAITWGDVIPDGEDHLETIDVPKSMQKYKRVFAMEADGESMEPTICAGDILFSCPDIELATGNIALVKYDGDKIVCKRWNRSGDTVILISDAPGVSPLILEGNRIEWAYRVMVVSKTQAV